MDNYSDPVYGDPFAGWTGIIDEASYDAFYGTTRPVFTGLPTPLTDARAIADLTAAKTAATAKGQTKLSGIFDFILKYGDAALTTLSKNGIIKNQNLQQAGYNISLGSSGTDSNTGATDSNSTPDPANRVFNIDFSDPKTLIIIFLIVMALVYFLFFNPKNSKNAKR